MHRHLHIYTVLVWVFELLKQILQNVLFNVGMSNILGIINACLLQQTNAFYFLNKRFFFVAFFNLKYDFLFSLERKYFCILLGWVSFFFFVSQ